MAGHWSNVQRLGSTNLELFLKISCFCNMSVNAVCVFVTTPLLCYTCHFFHLCLLDAAQRSFTILWRDVRKKGRGFFVISEMKMGIMHLNTKLPVPWLLSYNMNDSWGSTWEKVRQIHLWDESGALTDQGKCRINEAGVVHVYMFITCTQCLL